MSPYEKKNSQDDSDEKVNEAREAALESSFDSKKKRMPKFKISSIESRKKGRIFLGKTINLKAGAATSTKHGFARLEAI